MASFTDNPSLLGQFNPYVQQIPVDSYVQVGLEKQQQYNQGVQQTQASIDRIASLPVIKPEQKDYLSQRMNQLTGNISKIVGQDFSQSQLVNQVGALSSQIASDPIIQSAVSSTMRYQSESAKMDEAKTKGQSDPANEYDFQNSFNKWMGDKNVKSSFTGEYTPYVDVHAKLLKAINDGLPPEEQIQDLPFKMENGHQVLVNNAPVIDDVMVRRMSKSITPERIQGAINAAMSPGDYNQLAINGRYQYRGYDKAALKAENDASYHGTIGVINETLRGLAVKKLSNTTDQVYQEGLDKQINDLQLSRDSYIRKYPSDVKLLDQDPEAFKGQMYQQNYISNLTHTYARNNVSLTYEKNPYMQIQMEKEKNAIEAQKFIMEYGPEGYKAQQLDLERMKVSLKEQELLQGSHQKKDKNGNLVDTGFTDSLGAPVEGSITKENVPVTTLASFAHDSQTMKDAVDGEKMNLVANLYKDVVLDPKNPDDKGVVDIKTVDGQQIITYKNAAAKAYAETGLLQTKDNYDNHQVVDPAAATFFKNQGNTQIGIDNRNAFLASISKEAGKIINISDLSSNLTPLRLSNSTMGEARASKEDIFKFAQKLPSLIKVDAPVSMGPGLGGGSPTSTQSIDYEAVKNNLTTPAEKMMFVAYKKAFSGQHLNPSEKLIVNNLDKATATINANKGKLDEQSTYFNNRVNDFRQIQKPALFPIDAAKPEDRYRVSGLVNDVLAALPPGSESLPGGGDVKTISKMLDKKVNTTFNLEAAGNNTFNLALASAGLPTQRIPLTREQLEANFPGANVNQFAQIEDALAFTHTLKTPTTDVQGNDVASAFTANNPNLKNYSMKYHVEDPYRNGSYQIRAYITDPSGKALPPMVIPWSGMMRKPELAAFLANYGDNDIQTMLDRMKERAALKK